jgi:hypothetical protein
MEVRIYDDSEESLNKLGENIREIINQKSVSFQYTIPEIEPKSDLLGIPDSVYSQIRAALKSPVKKSA